MPAIVGIGMTLSARGPRCGDAPRAALFDTTGITADDLRLPRQG